jgi:hypothetical protein
MLDEEFLALLASVYTHMPTFTALRMEERKEESQSGEDQTGVGERDYIVSQSFSRCSGLSVVDVCADTIKSPIPRIFDGKFRETLRMTGQDDTDKVESWRTLQLDIEVGCLSLFLSHSARLDVLQTPPTA